jgi:hypothetical protein
MRCWQRVEREVEQWQKAGTNIRPGPQALTQKQLRRIAWCILLGAIDRPDHVVVELLREAKNFAMGASG